jgi:uncharacterized protein YgbK (DUF1537 family)
VIRVAIIADDLTGALDTASPFACHGAKTFCFTEPDAIDVNAVASADVISVSTNSRHLPPDHAATIAKAAAQKIRAVAPEIVLKKIDSRLKGNAAFECEAVASTFGRDTLLVVPGASDIGRHVINGAVTGAGVDSPIAVLPLFANCAVKTTIPDVSSHAAMQAIARSYLNDARALPVCARGFALALAECIYPDGVARRVLLNSPRLVAIGSQDPVTEAQCAALSNASGVLCSEALDGHVGALPTAWQGLLLHCTGTLTEAPATVARRFAQGVLEAITARAPGTLLCSGGDTARAVLQVLGQTCLHVLGEAAPGLPVSRIHLNGKELTFISKSGGFGKPSTLLDLFANQPGLGPQNADTDGPQH